MKTRKLIIVTGISVVGWEWARKGRPGKIWKGLKFQEGRLQEA